MAKNATPRELGFKLVQPVNLSIRKEV
jgi:hypothetical protein